MKFWDKQFGGHLSLQFEKCIPLQGGLCPCNNKAKQLQQQQQEQQEQEQEQQQQQQQKQQQ